MKKFKVLILSVVLSLMCAFPVCAASTVSSSLLVGRTYTVRGSAVKSSKKGIVSFKKLKNGKYRILARKPGATVVTVYGRGNKVVKKINFLVTRKRPFSYNTKKLTLKAGTSKKVVCKYPVGCKVKYYNSNARVISIRKDGTIKALRKGTATIKVVIYFKGKPIKMYRKAVSVTAKSNNGGSGKPGKPGKPGNDSNSKKTIVSANCVVSNDSVEVGESLKKSVISVTVTYSDGTKGTITNFSHNFTSKSVPGTYDVAITVPGFSKKLHFNLKVKERSAVTPSAELKGINAICCLNEVEYGYSFEKSDFVVKGVYSDGTKKLLGSWSYKASYTSKTCTVVVSHGDFSTTFTIPVKQKSSGSEEEKEKLVRVRFKLLKGTIYVGEDLAQEDVKVTAIYQKGSEMYEREVTGWKSNFTKQSKEGSYEFKVTWGNTSGTLHINVIKKGKKIVRYTARYNKSYILLGSPLNPDDLIVNAVYEDGTTGRITCEYDYTEASKSGEQGTIVVKIPNSTKRLTLKVWNYDRNAITNLEVKTYTPEIYVGESLQKKDFIVTGTKVTGEKEEMRESDFDLSWTSKDEAGVYPLVISCRGLKVEIDITVSEK